MQYIDADYWWQSLKEPNWYQLLRKDFVRLETLAEAEKNYHVRKSIKRLAYELVEQAYSTGYMPLATTGYDYDADREQVDTVVIHHTKNPPGMTLSRLNAMQLLRIYGSYFAEPNNPAKEFVSGQPVWSNHFYEGKQVFWCYHWFVRNDGTVERILDDAYIGWHSGNWSVNKKSVAICIDDDLSNKVPDETVINAMADLIKRHYKHINVRNIVAHSDVNSGTECPGRLFNRQWRAILVDQIRKPIL